MSSQLHHAAHELFPEGDGNIRNIKFFLGSARHISADDLAAQLLWADRQIAEGGIRPVADVDN